MPIALLAAAAVFTATPYPSDYKAVSKKYFEDTLKDPYSAHIEEIRGPRWTVLGRKGLLFDPRVPGWSVCFKVNAKNSYGGYTGFRTHLLLISAAGVFQDIETPDVNGYQRDDILYECSRDPDPAPAATGPSGAAAAPQ